MYPHKRRQRKRSCRRFRRCAGAVERIAEYRKITRASPPALWVSSSSHARTASRHGECPAHHRWYDSIERLGVCLLPPIAYRIRGECMAQPSKKNMLLLSGSTAAGNVPDGVTPGFLDFAEPWITALFAHAADAKQPILFVPYARPGGMSEAAYFTRAQARLGVVSLLHILIRKHIAQAAPRCTAQPGDHRDESEACPVQGRAADTWRI